MLKKVVIAVAFLLLLSVACGWSATYYIDYDSGSDSNNGTSKNTAWKRAPGMVGFAGSYAGPTAGTSDSFILKGGVTWPAGTMPWQLGYSGAASTNPMYYGVDATWYSGASWTRPVLDAEYDNTKIGRDDLYNVHEVGMMWVQEGKSNITIDNLELKRFLYTAPTDPCFGTGMVHIYRNSAYITVKNCYIHSWRTTGAVDSHHGGVQSFGPGTGGVNVNTCLIENSANTGYYRANSQNGTALRNIPTAFNNVIHDVHTAIMTSWGAVYGNEIYNIWDSFDNEGSTPCNPTSTNGTHENIIWATQSARVYNNYIHDVKDGYSGTTIYLNVVSGLFTDKSSYIYNNVIDMSSMSAPQPALNIGGANQANTAKVYIFNNSIIMSTGTSAGAGILINNGSNAISVIQVKNNHIIGANNAILNYESSPGYEATNQLVQTAEAAYTQGYSSIHRYAPTKDSGGTVNAGTTVQVDGVNLAFDHFNGTRLGVAQGAMDIGAHEWASGGVILDSTPAILEINAPEDGATLACSSNPLPVFFQLSSDEAALVRTSTVSQTYIQMSDDLETTGQKSHSETKSLSCGNTYTYFFASKNSAGLYSDPVSVSFSIAAPDAAFISGTRFGECQSCDVKNVFTDTYISSYYPNASYMAASEAFLRTYPASTPARVLLLKPDLSSIPAGSTITTARVYWYVYNGGGDASLDVSVHRVVTDSWTGAATWNKYNGSTAWSDTAGGLGSNIAAAESTQSLTTFPAWYAWDVTSMVSAWVSGTENNKGMAFTTDQGSNHAAENTFRGVRTSEYTDAALRPLLIIDYTPPVANNLTIDFSSGSLTINLTEGTLTIYLVPE